MSAWKAGGKYYLVDPWKHQEDYVDLANGAQSVQDASMAEAMERVKPFGDRPVVKRKFSYDAVKDFEDCSLDFVYVDAVHDYDGVRGKNKVARGYRCAAARGRVQPEW